MKKLYYETLLNDLASDLRAQAYGDDLGANGKDGEVKHIAEVLTDLAYRLGKLEEEGYIERG